MKRLCYLPFLVILTCQAPTGNSEIEQDNFQFFEISISELQQGYSQGKYTVRDVVQAFLIRIEDIDRKGPSLNSILQINSDALTIADSLDKDLQEGKIRGPLHGIPVVLKDNIDTHDKMPCTAGSRALRNSYPLKDSYVADRLRKAGAVIIGKANLSEWANFRGELSTSGWSGLGGQTKNPYVLDRNPCGSSSGSGVAVSANLTVLAIGTETDGSIVCPSQANGIVGIKPTVGLVSRAGVIPISSSQDTPGPMARTVMDAAICLGTLVGVDSLDSKTLESVGKYHPDYTVFLHEDGLEGKRLGIYREALGSNYKVDTLFAEAVEKMKSLGAEVIEIDRLTDEDLGQYELEVLLYEYKFGLNRYFEELGPGAPIKNLEELIAFNRQDSVELRYFNQQYLEMALDKSGLDSDEYRRAKSMLTRGARENGIDRIMDQYRLDAIIAPTGSPAWKTDLVNGDSFQLGSSSPSAQAGYPNITVPMGFIGELPVGISFFGRAWSEPILIEIAYAFEVNTQHRQAPVFKPTE